MLHGWGRTFADFALAAALVLEARLARAYRMVDHWMFPLEQQLAGLLRQPWLAEGGSLSVLGEFRALINVPHQAA